MEIKLWLNGKAVRDDVSPDMPLLEFLRKQGMYSVKRGCETSGCGLCSVLVEGKPVLSCTYPLMRADGTHITTLEGLEKEAEEFGAFLADEGADQCGFCNPGFIINVIAMTRELENPDEEDIKEYLAGNLCRCTGFMGQLRAVKKYIEHKRSEGRGE